jgi:hypothetical protein
MNIIKINASINEFITPYHLEISANLNK